MNKGIAIALTVVALGGSVLCDLTGQQLPIAEASKEIGALRPTAVDYNQPANRDAFASASSIVVEEPGQISSHDLVSQILEEEEKEKEEEGATSLVSNDYEEENDGQSADVSTIEVSAEPAAPTTHLQQVLRPPPPPLRSSPPLISSRAIMSGTSVRRLDTATAVNIPIREESDGQDSDYDNEIDEEAQYNKEQNNGKAEDKAHVATAPSTTLSDKENKANAKSIMKDVLDFNEKRAKNGGNGPLKGKNGKGSKKDREDVLDGSIKEEKKAASAGRVLSDAKPTGYVGKEIGKGGVFDVDKTIKKSQAKGNKKKEDDSKRNCKAKKSSSTSIGKRKEHAGSIVPSTGPVPLQSEKSSGLYGFRDKWLNEFQGPAPMGIARQYWDLGALVSIFLGASLIGVALVCLCIRGRRRWRKKRAGYEDEELDDDEAGARGRYETIPSPMGGTEWEWQICLSDINVLSTGYYE